MLREEIDGEAGVRVPEDTRAETVSLDIAAAHHLEALSSLSASMQLATPRVALSVGSCPRSGTRSIRRDGKLSSPSRTGSTFPLPGPDGEPLLSASWTSRAGPAPRFWSKRRRA
jgi:hypothetical protein